MATLLELDLATPLLEAPPQDPLAAVLARRRAQLHDVLEGLRRASTDPSVAGLIAHVGLPGPPMAHVQELRDAVRRFALAGKPTLAWTESFGELGPGTVPYYLATAFEHIWMQPSGDVGLTGLASEAVFLKDALAKVGVIPQLSHRHEYKNAADTFLADRMSAAHREATEQLTRSAMDQVVHGIVEGRGLSAERVGELVDQAPVSASEAERCGLVDQLGYRDQAYAAIRAQVRHADAEPRLQFVHRYHRSRSADPQQLLQRFTRRPAIGVIHAAGNIHLGRGGRSPGSGSIGSDTLGALLRAAASAEDVRAVVLRVNSGGGSYVASDALRREVLAVRAAGKPAVISMGSYAASGGYFIAMAADAIVAQPATLTGSIGVLGGKAVTRDLFERLGINRDGVAQGAHARMFSSAVEFSENEWTQLEEWLDAVYADFTAKVADDRGLSAEQAENAARGRVWTGADAHSLGLVDELGGLEHAIDVAASRAGLRRDEVETRPIPRFGLLERLRPADSSEDLRAAAASTIARASELGPAAALTSALGLPPAGVLTAPMLWRLR